MYGDRARVLVPNDAAVQARSASYAECSAYVITSDQEEPNEHDQANVQVFQQAIAALQEQLKVANSRAERFFEEERYLIEAEGLCSAELRAALIDAVAAERIAAGEAAALRAEANHRHAWRLLRRLGWALRRR